MNEKKPPYSTLFDFLNWISSHLKNPNPDFETGIGVGLKNVIDFSKSETPESPLLFNFFNNVKDVHLKDPDQDRIKYLITFSNSANFLGKFKLVS